jgi:tetratricopeptide (TPR) repeat protein
MGLVFVYLSKATPAKQMLQQATVLATLGNDRNLLARLNLTEGQLYTALGNKSVAWAKFKTASQYYAELNNRRGQSRALVAISRICAYDGDYVRAYDYALAAQEIALLANETNLECIALANAAVMLSNIRSFPEAMATAKKAAAIARSSGQELACCYTYNAIAQIYFDQGLYGKAVSPRREALRFARNISNRYLEITTLVALAQSYFYAAEYQEAERNFAKALSLVETGNCHYLEFIVLIGNARLAGRLEHRTLAQGYMKRAEGLLTKIDFHEGICDFYTAAAEILLQEQNFLEALLAAEKAITAAQKIASIMHEWMPRFIQAQALFQTGETAKALSAIDKAAKYLEQLSMAIADEDLRQQYLEQIDRKEVFSLHEELTAANVANSWAAEENAEEEVWDDE